MALNLHVPQQQDEFRPRICVVGVGGAGGNAINNMISSGLEGVEFLVCNTDAQDLSQSLCDNRLQLGPTVTKGLGAGMKPDVGAEAAQESLEEILHRLDGANMVFITAGMGGGTGTGAAPVIAKALRERHILTVGVVTKPFQFEGLKRAAFAEEGIANLSEAVDTLIVIPNQNLFRMANEKTTFADAFKMADNVLLDGVRGVSDLIVKPGIVNLDFADVRTLMTVMGKAMMGTGEAEGETRALEAAEKAIANPLLDDMSLDGAQGVLINVTGGMDVTLYEVDAVANHVREKVDPNANIIFGSSIDEGITGAIRVSVVATGIDADQMAKQRKPQGPQGTVPPQSPYPGGPGGGPSGPSGGPSGGPTGGGTPVPAPQQPAAPNTPPTSPFGRSPFAFRGNNPDQGPKSEIAAPASPEPTALQSHLVSETPASNDPVMVSNNYEAVPPAKAEVGFAAQVGQSSGEFNQPETVTPEADLFAQPASAPPAPEAVQEAPAAAPRLGGLFTRFAPKQETIPQAPAKPHDTQMQGGVAVAAAHFSAPAAQPAEPMQQSVFAQPAAAPQATSSEPAPALNLDAPQAYAPEAAPTYDSAIAPTQAHDPSTEGPKVVNLDDSANSGLSNFDASYKSVPAFLRHQNN